jgi:hypothetical protein
MKLTEKIKNIEAFKLESKSEEKVEIKNTI